MIEFQQGFIKLSPVNLDQVYPLVAPMLVQDEQIMAGFRSVRDSVVFTNKRIIAVNVQGVTGKKTSYLSFPYSKVQAFSIQTAGVLDRDCEIDLYFSTIGKVHFDIKGSFDIVSFNRIISQYVL